MPRSCGAGDGVGPVPNRPKVSLVLAVTATIAGILLVIQALSNADALGMVVWTLFTAGMAALAWSRR